MVAKGEKYCAAQLAISIPSVMEILRVNERLLTESDLSLSRRVFRHQIGLFCNCKNHGESDDAAVRAEEAGEQARRIEAFT